MPAGLRSSALRILRCLKTVKSKIDLRGLTWGSFRLEDIWTSLNGLEKCEILTWQELIPTRRGTPGWSGPKDQQNKKDKFLSFFGVIYVIVNSKKDKGKALQDHILKDILPRGFDARMEEIQKKHQQAIEKKDATISLFHDNLKNRKYENWACKAR